MIDVVTLLLSSAHERKLDVFVGVIVFILVFMFWFSKLAVAAARFRPTREEVMIDGRMVQTVRRGRIETLTMGLKYILPVLAAIGLVAYFDTRNLEALILVPLGSLILASPVWLIVRRPYGQTYFEDDSHFEVVTPWLHRKVSMRFSEIEAIAWPEYPLLPLNGSMGVRSVDGRQVMVRFDWFDAPKLESHLCRIGMGGNKSI